MTREEVLTALALEIHSNGTGRCTGCPLGDDPACTVTLAREALKLLKAQEPRVMTVEELCRARGKPAWFEARNGRLYTGWVIIYDVQTGLGITGTRVGVTEPGHVTIWPNVELYGQKWRCWTGEPTEEQRRATAWN